MITLQAHFIHMLYRSRAQSRELIDTTHETFLPITNFDLSSIVSYNGNGILQILEIDLTRKGYREYYRTGWWYNLISIFLKRSNS